MLLEVEAEIQERLVEHSCVEEHQHDQEPPDPTVAVQKRVNGLELGVDERGPD